MRVGWAGKRVIVTGGGGGVTYRGSSSSETAIGRSSTNTPGWPVAARRSTSQKTNAVTKDGCENFRIAKFVLPRVGRLGDGTIACHLTKPLAHLKDVLGGA